MGLGSELECRDGEELKLATLVSSISFSELVAINSTDGNEGIVEARTSLEDLPITELFFLPSTSATFLPRPVFSER